MEPILLGSPGYAAAKPPRARENGPIHSHQSQRVALRPRRAAFQLPPCGISSQALLPHRKHRSPHGRRRPDFHGHRSSDRQRPDVCPCPLSGRILRLRRRLGRRFKNGSDRLTRRLLHNCKVIYTPGIFTEALWGGIVSQKSRAKPGKERDMLIVRFFSRKSNMGQHMPSSFRADSLSARSYKAERDVCMVS